MSGNDTVNQEGVYGTKGNASVENVPGAREYAVGWFDSSRQEFWVFGGLNSFGSNSVPAFCSKTIFINIINRIFQ